ncbi:MAG: O-antigen ligase family protein [Chloroflexaceae bacterium]|nr:O-antigen ligase family protein [Chloroflexaceae bacterium]
MRGNVQQQRWGGLNRLDMAGALLAVVLGGTAGAATAFGPVWVLAGVLALVLAYALLTSVMAGLTLVVAIMTLIPFATLPFKAVITPTFLSLALLALFMVWVLRLLARSDRYPLRLSPLGLPLLAFLGFTFFSLILGARGLPDTLTLHNYAKFVLGVGLFLSVINGVRTVAQARLLLRALIVCGGIAALVGLLLYALNDDTALHVLTSLGRIGYPTEGRVLRYVEDDVDGLERAIGLSVDPNSFGGMLALISALAATQLFARRPVLLRGILIVIVLTMVIAILLSFSRAALFGLVAAMGYIATMRYRRLWWVMLGIGLLAVVLLFGLGIAGDVAQRLSEGVQFEDQAQQMRLAEFQNALTIIQRYPVFGIGFGQAPEIDLVAGVSSIYLTIGQRMGLVGLAAFVLLVAAWFWLTANGMARLDEERAAWLLGTQAGLIAALTVGLADHYFFNIEFSHMVALFWGCAGLGIAIRSLETADNDDMLAESWAAHELTAPSKPAIIQPGTD